MVLIRKPSVCVMKNMQEMQSSSNSRRIMVGQMWVVTAILLTTIIFTVNAEQAQFEGSELNRRLPSSHVIVDGFEVSLNFVVFFKLLCYLLFATNLFFDAFLRQFRLSRFIWLLFNLMIWCPFDVCKNAHSHCTWHSCILQWTRSAYSSYTFS